MVRDFFMVRGGWSKAPEGSLCQMWGVILRLKVLMGVTKQPGPSQLSQGNSGFPYGIS